MSFVGKKRNGSGREIGKREETMGFYGEQEEGTVNGSRRNGSSDALAAVSGIVDGSNEGVRRRWQPARSLTAAASGIVNGGSERDRRRRQQVGLSTAAVSGIVDGGSKWDCPRRQRGVLSTTATSEIVNSSSERTIL